MNVMNLQSVGKTGSSVRAFGSSLVVSRLLLLALSTLFFIQPAQAQTPADGIDVVLIIDTSGSMEENDPQAVRISAAKLFVDLSSEGDRIALVNLGGPAETGVVLDLTEIFGPPEARFRQKRRIKEVLDTLANPQAQHTNIGNSLKAAYDILENTPPGRRQYVVLLTDGQPTGEPPEALEEAMTAFKEKRFWKVFPIALGPGADYELLKSQVADRTGSRAYKADTPEDLIRVYTEIFALLRYNRYVNWITVQPNILASILTLTPEQRVTDLALVIPQQNKESVVDVILSPGGVNVTDPAYAQGVYYGLDPRYRAYAINEHSTPLVGEWKMRLLGQAPAEIAVLARSDYGIQLAMPAPLQSWDELSPRYHPLGEPLYIQSSVRNFTDQPVNFDPNGPVESGGSLSYGLNPLAQMAQPDRGPVVLRDDGLGDDIEPGDGHYGGLYFTPTQAGQYLLDIEVPNSKSSPFRLVKSRQIEVLPLPSLELTLPEFEQTRRQVPLRLQLEQPPDQYIPVESLEATLYLKDPFEETSILPTIRLDESSFSTDFPVSTTGSYEVWAIARVGATVGGRKIVYTSVARQAYDVPLPNITIQPSQINLGILSELENVPVTLKVGSEALSPETVSVRLEGVVGGSVEPDHLTILPGEPQEVQLIVGSSELQSNGPGQFHLSFASSQGTARLERDQVVGHYTVVQNLIVIPQDPPGTYLDEIETLERIRVTVIVKSNVAHVETLQVQVQGSQWAEATVFPTEIEVPPKEETAFTFDISAKPSLLPEKTDDQSGQFHLLLSSDKVALEGGEITYHYRQTSSSFPNSLLCIGGSGALILGAAIFIWRRR